MPPRDKMHIQYTRCSTVKADEIVFSGGESSSCTFQYAILSSHDIWKTTHLYRFEVTEMTHLEFEMISSYERKS